MKSCIQWFAVFCFVVLTITISAQVSTGVPPLGSFSSGPDVINLGNLNVHFEIPVFSKPGRGTSFDYILSVDTSIWSPQGGAWTPVDNWGWRNISEVATGFLTRDSTNEECGLSPSETLSPQTITTKPRFFNFQYHDKFGVIHSFANTAGGCPGDGIDNVSTSADASGDVLDTTTTGKWTITTPDGHSFKPPIGSTAGAGTYTDRNGNQISSSGSTFTDTLGVTALSVTGTAPSPTVFTYTNSSGTPASVTMNYTSYTVQTAFGCAGVTEFPATSKNLVSSVVLPDGSSYSFQYEPTPGHAGNVTGRISEITLRTGGTIQYAYSGGSNGIECVDGTTSGFSRTTADGTSSYSRSGSGTAWTTTYTDATPANPNTTVMSFQAAGTPVNFYETHRVVNQGSPAGTLLTTDTCYNTAAEPNCSTTGITLPISEIKRYTILPNANQSLVDTQLNGLGLSTEVDEYDFGAAPKGSLLRTTLTSYASLGNIGGLPSSITVNDQSGHKKSGQTFGYDETAAATTTGVPQHVAVTGSRGNLTTFTQWVNATPTTLSSTFTYDDTGNVITLKDPAGNITTFDYTDNFSDSGALGTRAFATKVTMPVTGGVAHVNQSQYELNTGLLATSTDLNGNITTYSYDSLLRPLTVNSADGGQISYSYPSATSVTKNQKLSATQNISTAFNFDDLGRISQEQLTSDPSGTDTVDTTYDVNGFVHSVSNPHRSTTNTTDGITTYTYDALGRMTLATEPDGDTRSASFTNNCVTFADEVNKQRKECTDAIGRVISTFEPDSTLALNWETDTSYDPMNNPISITQMGGASSSSWRTRTFAYDGLSRMTQQASPEAGTTSMGYTTSGGSLCAGNATVPCQITDARGIITSLAYDALSRLTGKTYSDTTHSVSYAYDQTSVGTLTITNPNGLRTSMTDGSGSTAWSYDKMGRVVTRQQTISTVTKSIGYTYNLDGSVATMTSPSGRTYTYSYNNVGQVSTLKDLANNVNFFSSPQYAPPGMLTSGIQGAVTGWNAITLTNTYNNRLQPTQFQAVSPLPSTLLNLSYTYDQGSGNNGNILKITNGRDGGRTVSYTYDQVNRIGSAQTAATWGNLYGYDAWGNLLQKTVTVGTAESMTLTVNNKNQVTSPAFTYDAAGNVTSDTSVSMVYDAEGHMNPTSGTTYTYDGDGRRVLKSDGTVYWMDDQLRPISVGTTSGSITKDYIFLGSQRIAMVPLSSGNPYYYLSDRVGSTAVIASGDGKSIQWEADYFPFGSVQHIFTSLVGNNYEFTGYENDSATGYNYANARYEAGRWGKFLSPDPYVGSIDVTDPQSLNRYSYVENQVTRLIDPFGLDQVPFTCITFPDGSQICTQDSPLQQSSDSAGSGDDVSAGGFSGGMHQPLLSPGGEGGSGINKKKAACLADVALNFGLGFIPGYNAVKFAAAAAGINFNVFQNVTSGTSFMTASPNGFSALAALGSGYSAISLQAFKNAGGVALNNLPAAGAITELGKIASAAGTISNVLNALSAAHDAIQCVQKP